MTYTKKELAGKGPQRTFKGDQLQQIAFPLGGIGAGCLHIGGREIFRISACSTPRLSGIRR